VFVKSEMLAEFPVGAKEVVNFVNPDVGLP